MCVAFFYFEPQLARLLLVCICVYIYIHTYTHQYTFICMSTPGWRATQGFLPELNEFYFTTAGEKTVNNCKSISFRILSMTNSFQ
jgi:hypothetical protein